MVVYDASIHPMLLQIAHERMGQIIYPIYVILDAGMGCYWYIRRKHSEHYLEFFFMHCDGWGQYGPPSDERPQLEEFLDGYAEL